MKSNELNPKQPNQPIAQKSHHRKDVNDIVTRQQVLADIIFDLKSENKSDKPKVLLKLMKEKGYDIDRSTLYRDRVAINQRNNFVRDLSESNYSYYIESMWSDIELVKQESQEVFLTTKSDSVKNNAGKLILETVRTKVEMLNGRVLDVSVELLGKKLREFRDENKDLKQRLESHDSV